MSLERRLANLERLQGDHGPPYVLVVAHSGASESDIEAAKEEAMRKRPGQRFFYVVVPPPERGQDVS
jgi:hypothetical protein